jgi:hypothetical protein
LYNWRSEEGRCLDALRSVGETLEPLRQPGEERAARTKLRRKDPEPGAAAKLVDLIEQVDDVKAELQPLVDAGVDRLDDAEINLLIARQGGSIRGPARALGPEPAAGGQVSRKKGVPGGDLVFDAS